ncbi:RNA polymerase sigma factor [Evansella halocellulosilytica]|uniref:RNA polymerase sigma factor n=1 Tax=Evansella halocellulosilytica TaxID=2011013 RepID=UPI0015CE6C86|nr:RNA polymerase sigma factor [Evansella halocellulosilytica]
MTNDHIKAKINDWYHHYSNDIYQYIFFMIYNHDEAKDLTQDTFIRAYSHFNQFDGENVKGWLFRIARNLTIDHIRKAKGLGMLTKIVASNDETSESPEQIVILNESERELYRGLYHLKSNYRDVIVLRKIQGFSIKETASILGWSSSKVKSTLLRGLKELKKQMVKEGYIHESV